MSENRSVELPQYQNEPPQIINSTTQTGGDFQKVYGESLAQILDVTGWKAGVDLDEIYARTQNEVADAVIQADRTRQSIRDRLFPAIQAKKSTLPCAGVYQLELEQVASIHRHVLFNGGAEASDGTMRVFESLPLTITQIGVALVSYNGSQGTYSHRLYRRDLREKGQDPAEEALALLERRQRRSSHKDEDEPASMLFRRGLMAYAERLLLLKNSKAPWRIGHGNPVSYELLTGAGHVDLLLRPALAVLEALLLEHKRVLYVVSNPADRVLRTIADVLAPLEFAIIENMTEQLFQITGTAENPRQAHYSEKDAKVARKFAEEVGQEMVIGVYRASRAAPGQVFYAHKDYAHEAAAIAIADSILQDFRGFPMLIDLADMVCSATFDGATFTASIQTAFTQAGAPGRYLDERLTRQR
jgi:hypothetical protein